MNTEQLEQTQRTLAQKVLVPQDDPDHPRTGDLVFTLDVQYAGDIGYVATDVMSWGGSAPKVFVCKEKVEAEYIPGFFAFREGPLLESAIRKTAEAIGGMPKLVVVDGHGLAHPRKFGVACWLGLRLGIPTIGVAKEPLVKWTGELGQERGSTLPVTVEGEVVGQVLRSSTGVKPIFVSPGHLVSIAKSVELALQMDSGYRVIEPVRRADQAARAYAKGQLFPHMVEV